jgi:hypothetical protein
MQHREHSEVRAQRPPRKKKKTLGMQRPEPEVTEGKTQTKFNTG